MTSFQKIAVAILVAARAGNGGGLLILLPLLPIVLVLWLFGWVVAKTVTPVIPEHHLRSSTQRRG